MRILFLDDNAERHVRFRHNSIGMDVVHVYSHEEAVQALAGDRFDQIFLDHDLSVAAACGVAPADEKTGYDTALAVAALPPDRLPDLVVIHSWNDPGSARMLTVLQEVVHTITRPFSAKTAPFRLSRR